MPTLSKQAAKEFALKWRSAENEIRDYQSFWEDFFRHLCGVDDTKIAGIEFQYPVKSASSGNQNWIDVFWKNVAIIEHKSKGEDLDKAELQARGYLRSLPPGYRPRTIIISDFATFRLIDVTLNRTHEFTLEHLPENIHRFGNMIAGSKTSNLEDEILVDQEAAKLMANLYLELEANGYRGHETSVFLVRLLFLLFGDDTKMWEHNIAKKLLLSTKGDGSDVGETINNLFKTLNTPKNQRREDKRFKDFPYVNGGLFAEDIGEIQFVKRMRRALIDAANYDWSTINPTIFGSLFQLIKSKEERAALGEHYTSEENINKIIYPLFLSSLQERLNESWDSKKELKALRKDLGKVKILDPACGCGNFLVVAYRHLRQLELELIVRLQELEGKDADIGLDGTIGLVVGLHQLFGIEILEWPSQVARVALFLTDHQENSKLEKVTGTTVTRFPLTQSATIKNANSLVAEWTDLLIVDNKTYILGNPPFVGTRLQSKEQREWQSQVWGGYKGSASVDHVANWLLIAAKFVHLHGCSAAFVATNSITQGNQPSIIWEFLSQYTVEINFAHRTFSWANESTGQAAVHCVILGIVRCNSNTKQLWTYVDTKAEPQLLEVSNINAYLIDGDNILVKSRRKPLSPSTPLMISGNKPRDGGFLSDISRQEAKEIKESDSIAAKYLRELVGAEELLNARGSRFCLWLLDATPGDLKQSPILKHRVALVLKERRAATSSKGAAANRPALFETITQPKEDYFAIPSVSSEKRQYVPIDFVDSQVILNNALFSVETNDLSLFAFLSSQPFSIWVQNISSRLKSDYQISASVVYNTFPFPKLSDKQRDALSDAAKEVIDIRNNYPEVTLGDLYDPVLTPPELLKAHKKIDSLTLKYLDIENGNSDREILQGLFKAYLAQIEDHIV